MAGYLRCIVGADQVARGKPAPDVYLEAARCLGLSPEACLAIEDTPTGVRAALAAECAACSSPNPDIEVPDLEGVEAVFPSLSAFHDALDEVLPHEPRQV